MPSSTRFTINHDQLFRETNAPGGQVRRFMNQTRLITADALQRNAPRNSPLNERHRERGNPNYALGFRTQMRGNQSSSGFTVTNVVDHAEIVEFGRTASSQEQGFSFTGWGGQIRRVKHTKGRPGTKYMSRTVERVARRRAAG